MKYVISIFGIMVGIFLVIKTETVLKTFGYSEWAEAKFRIWGGSRAFYKFIGLVIITVSTMWMTGWAQDVLVSIFNPQARMGL